MPNHLFPEQRRFAASAGSLRTTAPGYTCRAFITRDGKGRLQDRLSKMLNPGLESTSTGKMRYGRIVSAYRWLPEGCQTSLLSNDSVGAFWRQMTPELSPLCPIHHLLCCRCSLSPDASGAWPQAHRSSTIPSIPVPGPTFPTGSARCCYLELSQVISVASEHPGLPAVLSRHKGKDSLLPTT